MQRPLLTCLAAFLAATLASIAFFFVPETSRASPPPSEGGPSQGTLTQGASAGPHEPSLVRDTPPSASVRDAAVLKVSATGPVGRNAVRLARTHIGTPYRPSPPGLCRAYKTEDCSCFTRLVFTRLRPNRPLPDNPIRQFRWGKGVSRQDLRPGDLVFFKEAGRARPITHVGIYSGRGNLIHASNYFHRVVESKMSYMRGYYGARRLIPPA
jgi:cell wall-associated NlpC family hydrolase